MNIITSLHGCYIEFANLFSGRIEPKSKASTKRLTDWCLNHICNGMVCFGAGVEHTNEGAILPLKYAVREVFGFLSIKKE